MFTELLNILTSDNNIFRLIILPLLIFFARVTDVSINTLRVIYMLNGRKLISTVLGFFESIIWLIAIGQILQNMDSWISYVAYAGGFAAGISVGMMIEDRLAIGNVIVRIITQKDAEKLIESFKEKKFRLTVVDAEGSFGPVNIIFLIVRRQDLESVTQLVERTNPQAIFTVEGVKSVKYLTDVVPDPKPERYSFFKYIKRK